MMSLTTIAVCLALAAAPRDGEVRSVSVLPAAGRVEVVIDLQGAVEVRDFTLQNPPRLVVDLMGARLTAPATLYDGQNRGGIKNIRFGQFPEPSQRVELPSYTTVDLSSVVTVLPTSRGRFGLDLTARVENLFDEQYQQSSGFPARGRGVFVGISAVVP